MKSSRPKLTQATAPQGCALARLGLISCLALVASLTLVSGASAHTLTSWTKSGEISSTFTFKGKAWQPSQRITARYFVSENAAQPLRTFPGKTRRNGTFTFFFNNAVGLVDAGITAKMCFRQLDTRVGKTFNRCASFYVEPPSALFEPSIGRPGDAFVLAVSGFPAGRTLTVTLTKPDATTEQSTITTRTSPGFVTGGPLGRIYVPRGGGAELFQSSTGDPPGLYTAVVQDAAGATARAAVLLATG